jgi:hypothetical protein
VSSAVSKFIEGLLIDHFNNCATPIPVAIGAGWHSSPIWLAIVKGNAR